MPIRFRKTLKLGPVRWNFTRHGLSSWSIKLGPLSWNSRRRRAALDLPGPFRWEPGTRTSGKTQAKTRQRRGKQVDARRETR